MRGLNRVQLIGNVGAEPEVKYTDQGTARTTFSVAINRQWKDADGQVHQETEWLPIVTWGTLAEIAGEHLTTGKRVYLEGRVHTSAWHNDAGEKRYRTEVVANELIFLDTRSTQAASQTEEAIDTRSPSTDHPRAERSQRTNSTPRHQRPPVSQAGDGDLDWEAVGL